MRLFKERVKGHCSLGKEVEDIAKDEKNEVKCHFAISLIISSDEIKALIN